MKEGTSDSCPQDGTTPLFVARQEGQMAVARRLILARAHVGTKLVRSDVGLICKLLV